jgi:hypothetical protein
VRTVAIPAWVKQGINAWMTAAGVEDGRMLRAVTKGGKVKESMSGRAVWSVVEQSARLVSMLVSIAVNASILPFAKRAASFKVLQV